MTYREKKLIAAQMYYSGSGYYTITKMIKEEKIRYLVKNEEIIKYYDGGIYCKPNGFMIYPDGNRIEIINQNCFIELDDIFEKLFQVIEKEKFVTHTSIGFLGKEKTTEERKVVYEVAYQNGVSFHDVSEISEMVLHKIEKEKFVQECKLIKDFES